MKAYWIVGIILLASMFIAVATLLSGNSANAKGDKHDTDSGQAPDKIVAWGYFDGDKGVAGLDPRQFGDVVMVAPENAEVKKGDVILQIDDGLAKLKVKAADLQLDEAKKLKELYKYQIEEHKETVKIILQQADSDIARARANGSAALIKEAESQKASKIKASDAKLKQLELQDGDLKIKQAQTQLKEAEAMLKYFQIVAPSDGTVLRINVREGEVLAGSAMRHAVEFLPKGPIVVKAEVMQEWGRYVEKGLKVVIEDDTYKGPTWEGTVRTISGWYAPIRSPVIEPFRMNGDVRTLECIIDVDAKKDAPTARIGQRVRAKIQLAKQAGK